MTDESPSQPNDPAPGSGPHPGQPPPPPPYEQPPYEQPPYEQPPYGQPPYGQPPYQTGPHGMPPQQAPYSLQPPYPQPPYPQPPYGPSYGPGPVTGEQAAHPQVPYQPGPYGSPSGEQGPYGGRPLTGPYGGPPLPVSGMYAGGPLYAPRADPKLLRPPLWWVWAAWGLALVCVVAGVALFAGGVADTARSALPTRTFGSGETVTVNVDPADEPVVYLASASPVQYTCSAGGAGKALLARMPGSMTVTQGSTTWRAILALNVPKAGGYQLKCDTAAGSGARFAVGPAVDAGGLLGGVAALFLLPGAGVLVAVVLTVVVLARRSGHRRRLAAGG
ncbi:hypothetical protein [Nonomuraea sp. NPDC005501]|uniref:hypothetical protein n=1 Tax=Nonomuraea sp. NPDC005501 TaxID=3156884 RepID=UPI0033B59020